MKALLTSDGMTSKVIRDHFYKTLPKPVEEVKCLIIPFACETGCKDKYILQCLTELCDLGLKEENIHFVTLQQKIVEWDNFDMVSVPGGNTYLLLKRLKDSYIFNELQDLILNGSMYYYGISAGSCIAADNVAYIRDTDPNFVGLKDTRGLWLSSLRIWPHTVEGDIEELEKYEFDNVYTLKDGEAVFLTNQTITHL